VHFHLNSTGVGGNHGNGLRALSRIMERRECLQQDDCFLSPPQYMTVLEHPALAPSTYMLLSYTYSPLCRWMNSHSLLWQHLHSNGADMSEMPAWCITVDICSKSLTRAVQHFPPLGKEALSRIMEGWGSVFLQHISPLPSTIHDSTLLPFQPPVELHPETTVKH